MRIKYALPNKPRQVGIAMVPISMASRVVHSLQQKGYRILSAKTRSLK